MHKQTMAAREKVLGKQHPKMLTSVYCLAYLLGKQHHYDEASTLYERVYTEYRTIFGYDDPRTQVCR